MVVALIAPLALEAALYIHRFEHVAHHGTAVTLLQEDRRAPMFVPRTAASPELWQGSVPVSTSASYPDQVAGLAVVVEPAGDVSSHHEPAVSGAGPDDRVPSMLAGIKRMTGWSWERVAEVLGRSRQAVHAWTLGKEINQPNLERLARLHATLCFIDRGDTERNRALLHTAVGDGSLVADLLDAGRFDEVQTLLGPGDGNRDLAARLRFAASVQQDEIQGISSGEDKPHWFDRLAQHESWIRETGGEEQALEIIPSGERKRVVLRRRG